MPEECETEPQIIIGARAEIEEIAIGAVETLPYALLVVDVNGQIQLFNKEAELLFGYNRVEVLGKHVEMLLPDALKQTHVKMRDDFAMHPKVREMGAGKKLTAKTRTGREIEVVIHLSPFMSLTKGMLVNAVLRRADVIAAGKLA